MQSLSVNICLVKCNCESRLKFYAKVEVKGILCRSACSFYLIEQLYSEKERGDPHTLSLATHYDLGVKV